MYCVNYKKHTGNKNSNVRKTEKNRLMHDKYMTTSESDKLTAESFATSLKQANLVTKTK